MTAPRRATLLATPRPDRQIHRRGRQRSFTGDSLDQIAFPLGGIGAGSICLAGSGYLTDAALLHKPAVGAPCFAFAAMHAEQKGRPAVTRVLEGPVPVSRIYNCGKWSHGQANGLEGLPRCRKATFRGEFPFAFLRLEEPSLPLACSLRAWSPFIPLDDRASGMPVAILEYTFANRGAKSVQSIFSYAARPPAMPSGRTFTFRRRQGGAGIEYVPEGVAASDPAFGSFVLGTTAASATANCAWFRGGAFDARTMFWNDFSRGVMREAHQSLPEPQQKYPKDKLAATLYVPFELRPGQQITIAVILAWHYPNNPLRQGQPKAAEEATGPCQCASCGPEAQADAAQPWYATQWRDAWDVAGDVFEHYASLEARTSAFHKALFATTAPAAVLDAVSANLAILRTPTVMRQKSGTVWCWEGCNPLSGCCHGSCTHVWNYAQAMPHLFPQLERTLRQDEYDHAMDDRGHASFRFAFPEGPAGHGNHAASDGQLGGVMKVYREWMVSGDDGWLRRYYPAVKKSLDYCIAAWDPKREGRLVEPHHNTYDIEFWGPDSMCASFYLGALRAIVEMGRYLGEDVEQYQELADRGLRRVNRELYNGRYYFQTVLWPSLAAELDQPSAAAKYTPESVELMRKEGPKYQYGTGCLSDGVIGQWHTTMYGLPDALDRRKARSHLRSVFQHNFRASLRDHANPQRGTYALGDEAGLLLCSWPRGGQPSLPFIYSNEVWTGIEYQVASHCIYEGLVAEGLTIVQAARDRYDGRRRNPWDEYECGSYYARAMASYAVLTALFGFRYDAPYKRLVLAPRLAGRKQATFFSTARGFGTIRLEHAGRKTHVTIDLAEGALEVAQVHLEARKGARFRSCCVSGESGTGSVLRQGEFFVAQLPAAVRCAAGQAVTITLQ